MLAHNPQESPTFGSPPSVTIPTHQRHERQQSSPQSQSPSSTSPSSSKAPSSWSGRKFFTRRVQSMQPPLRAADDAAVLSPTQLKRSASEAKQFDGWPFGGGGGSGASKSQRFSVSGLGAAIQPLRARKSSDSAPPS